MKRIKLLLSIMSIMFFINGFALAQDTTLTVTSAGLRVTGTIESASGGFKFPDGTIQNTAAANRSIIHVEAVGNQHMADAGDTDPATIVVAVNSSGGPVTGLILSDFNLKTHATSLRDPGLCPFSPVELIDVTENQAGAYSLAVVPFTGNSGCLWLLGEYSISILVTTPQGQAVGVTKLLIDVVH